MSEPRNLKLDLIALGLLALTIFVAAALLSYHPADPPSTVSYPARVELKNICGRSGAVVSSLLLTAFGMGAYYLLLSMAVVDGILLARRTIDQPCLRLFGWLLSLIGLSTFAAMALSQFSPGPVIGAGGYLGAAGRGLLEMNFASVGAYILTLSLIVGGLLLSTDYVLLRLVSWTLGRPAQGLGRGVAKVGAAYAQKLTQRRSDLDDVPDEEEADDVAVRISRPAQDEAQGGDEEKAAEPAVADAAAAPAEKPEPTVRRTFAKMLGLSQKKPEHGQVIAALDAAVAETEETDYELPTSELLLPSESFSFDAQEKEVRRKAKVLEKTFADFGFNVRVVEIQTGPVIAQFEVELEAGLRLSKITSLADDLAIALRVPSVRIVAPIPGKNTVGVEVPNTERQIVRLREVIEEATGRAAKMRLPIYLGKDVAGAPMVCDLTSLPHLLIAGRTGTGKSVCLNSIIVSMLMTRRPEEVRMLLIDPKMVELSPYKSIPHLMHPVVTDMRKAEAILAWAVEKMEERYHLLARAGVRHISNYNQLGEEELMERIQPEGPEERQQIPLHMPYIVIVADELADLMMTAAKEVEGHIIRLAQKSRAVGIHLVLATQKPTVDVITGLIKSNLPARICFQVASRTDSRVVLDEMGADKLLGNGDMLFLWPGTSTLLRGQGTYVSDDEINKIIAAVATSEPQFVKELVQLQATAATADGKTLASRDDLYEAAIDVVVHEGRGSVSLLQRALGIGYGRAARLVDFMAEDGIVGSYNGSQAREVLLSVEDWENRNNGAAGSAATPAVAPAAPKRSNTIQLATPRSEADAPAVPGRGAAAASAAARPPADEYDDAPDDGESDDTADAGNEAVADDAGDVAVPRSQAADNGDDDEAQAAAPQDEAEDLWSEEDEEQNAQEIDEAAADDDEFEDEAEDYDEEDYGADEEEDDDLDDDEDDEATAGPSPGRRRRSPF